MSATRTKTWIVAGLGIGALAGVVLYFTRRASRHRLLKVEKDLAVVDGWDESDLARMKIAEDSASQARDYEYQAVLLENMAMYCTRKGMHEEAALQLKALLNVQEKVYQTSVSKESAATLYMLGLSYGQSAQPLLAIAAFERLLELETKLGVAFHQAYQPLAAIYVEMGQYAKAQELYEAALAEGADQLGPAARKYYDGLAVCLLELGTDNERAKALLESSLELAAASSPVDKALALIHLARYDAKLGDQHAAIFHMEDAVALIRAHAGLTHPDLPGTLSDLARLYLAVGKYGAAEDTLVMCKETLELGGVDNVADIANTQRSIDNVREQRAIAANALGRDPAEL